MYLETEERYLYGRTETSVYDLNISSHIKSVVGFGISSIEEIEHLKNEEIATKLSSIKKKDFSRFLEIVNQFRKEDLEKANIHISRKKLISVFDKIIEFWLLFDHYEMLEKTSLSNEEVNLLIFRHKYSGVSTPEEIDIFNLGLPIRIKSALYMNNIKTVGDIVNNKKKVAGTYHIGEKSIKEIDMHVNSVFEWCKTHPFAEIPDDRKIDIIDDIIDIICDKKDRRYLRAYLRTANIDDYCVSYIVHIKFPNEELGVTIC